MTKIKGVDKAKVENQVEILCYEHLKHEGKLTWVAMRLNGAKQEAASPHLRMLMLIITTEQDLFFSVLFFVFNEHVYFNE